MGVKGVGKARRLPGKQFVESSKQEPEMTKESFDDKSATTKWSGSKKKEREKVREEKRKRGRERGKKRGREEGII